MAAIDWDAAITALTPASFPAPAANAASSSSQPASPPASPSTSATPSPVSTAGTSATCSPRSVTHPAKGHTKCLKRTNRQFREGHHPLIGVCDNTGGEPLAWMLRRGSAGSNTTADHLQLLDAAIAAVPPGLRRRLMVTCDGAGASHGLIARLDKLAARRGYELTYSVGLGAGRAGEVGAAPGPGAGLAGRDRSAAARSASAAPMTPARTCAARTGRAGSKKRTSPS